MNHFKHITLGIFLALTSALSAATPTKVACVGNSITEGYKLENPATESYPSQLAVLLGEDYEVGNFGKTGATLTRHGYRPYWEQPQYKAALEFAPDILLIHLGINDTDPRVWPDYADEFVQDYVDLINSFKAVNQEVRVIIAKLTPIGVEHGRFKSGTWDWRERINAHIEEIAAATGAELIDYGYPLMDRRDLIPDTLHPTAEGAGIMAQKAASAITGNYGGLQVPRLYQDGMVLQRGNPITLRGTADAGAKVKVTLNGKRAATTANNRGEWEVTLPAMRAASGQTLTISDGKSDLRFNDVAIGEVWLASGQSNMEFKLRHSAEFKADSALLADPLLRLYNMQPVAYTNAQPWNEAQVDSTDRLLHFTATRWEESTPESAANFSAVAWEFGRMLRDSLQVPVGIILNAIGGSGTEAWIAPEDMDREYPEVKLNWRTNDYLQPWVRQRIGENTQKGHRHPYEPTYLFSAGIRPLEKYPLAGVIWYQGESNAHNVEMHERLFRLLVDSWRKQWGNDALPFFTTQLSSINRPSWPEFRDSQRRLALEMEGVHMAVTSDLGEPYDVHPRRKKAVGQRLALQALHKLYGREIESEGPQCIKATKGRGGKVVLTMTHARGMAPEHPLTFEVAEFDGLYKPAQATVRADGTIVLESKEIANPRYVRYGWQPYTEANLVNGQGLPASTFKVRVE